MAIAIVGQKVAISYTFGTSIQMLYVCCMAKHKSCIIHDWSTPVIHPAKIYSRENAKHYQILIEEKVCKKCDKLKAKLVKGK